MKKQKRRDTKRAKPTANKLSVLHQLCNFNMGYLVSKLPRKHGVDKSLRDRIIEKFQEGNCDTDKRGTNPPEHVQFYGNSCTC